MENKKSLSIQNKLFIAVGSTVVLFITVFLLRDTFFVSSYRLFMKKTVNHIFSTSERYDNEDGRIVESKDFVLIDKNIPFKVERPQWLPEGYVLEYTEYVYYEGDNYNITYKFNNENDKTKYMEFHISSSVIIKKRDFCVEFQEILVNDNNVFVTEYDDIYYSAQYMNNQGFAVSIGGTIDKETLIKIIENMG